MDAELSALRICKLIFVVFHVMYSICDQFYKKHLFALQLLRFSLRNGWTHEPNIKSIP